MFTTWRMNYDVVRRERGRSWKMSAGGRIGLADVTRDLAVVRGTWHHPALRFGSFQIHFQIVFQCPMS